MKLINSGIACKSIDGNIHVMPAYEPDHIESENCYCGPSWDEQNKKDYRSGLAKVKVFIHKEKKEIEQ